MKTIKKTNLLDEPADALIYSTNVLMNLTGGVGAQLLERYPQLQTELHDMLRRRGSRYAIRGEVISHRTVEMPWKAVFHTIPCDPMYHTTPGIVTEVLRKAFEMCLQTPGVRKVATSAIATGYGDMAMDDFMKVFEEVTNRPQIRDGLEVVLCLPVEP